MEKAKGNWYTVVATDSKFVPGEGDRADSISLTVRIVEGEKTGEEHQFWLGLGEKSMPYSIKTLRALGWNCNDITVLKGLGDLKANAVFNDKVYNGKTKTYISAFPMKERESRSEESLREFAKKYKAAAVEEKPVVPTKANLAPEVLPPTRAATATPTTNAADPGF